MKMVRGGCTAFRPVVEYREVRKMSCQVGHVRHTVPYRLGHMDIPGYHQMLRENRIGIHQHLIAAPLSSFECHKMLLFRPVGTAKETFSALYGSLVHLRCGRTYALRVMLDRDFQTAHHEFTRQCFFH